MLYNGRNGGNISDYNIYNYFQDCDAKFAWIGTHSACLPKSPDASDVGVDAATAEEILDKHNDLRGGVDPPATDMMKMVSEVIA